MDSTLRFNAVHVLESLEGEERTGEYLVDEVLQPAKFEKQDLDVRYRRVRTGRELLRELATTAAMAEQTGLRPVVHIEAHGGKDGLLVASGEHVPWPDLRDVLTRINASTGLHLLLVMAMCRGIYLSRILRPMDPAPAWGIIGPSKEPKPRDLSVAMQGLYRGLLVHDDGRRALFDMNEGRPPAAWDYGFMNAEWLFCQAFRRYVRDATPEALQQRENELVAKVLRDRGSFDLALAADARERARVMLRDHASFFETMKNTFFMFEQWPANRERFKLASADCIGDRGLDAADDEEGEATP